MKKGEIMTKEQKEKIKKATKKAMARPDVRNKIEKTFFKKGYKPVFTKERNKKLSKKLKGHIVSDITREKLRKFNTGIKKPPRTKEFKEMISKRMMGNKHWINGRGKRNTLPERLIEAELNSKNIFYEKQVCICGFYVDFYLPQYRLIIECDGDYWHNLPNIIDRDLMKNSVWAFEGFKVYRFWEHDIKKSAKDCINRIVLPKD